MTDTTDAKPEDDEIDPKTESQKDWVKRQIKAVSELEADEAAGASPKLI